MTTSKKLRTIAVTPADGTVGITLMYTEGPSEHVLLPYHVGRDLRDKLTEALAMAKPKAVGDGVSVSDHVAMSLKGN